MVESPLRSYLINGYLNMNNLGISSKSDFDKEVQQVRGGFSFYNPSFRVQQTVLWGGGNARKVTLFDRIEVWYKRLRKR